MRNNGSVIEGKPGSYSIKDANIKACFKDRVVTSVKCYCGYIRWGEGSDKNVTSGCNKARAHNPL